LAEISVDHWPAIAPHCEPVSHVIVYAPVWSIVLPRGPVPSPVVCTVSVWFVPVTAYVASAAITSDAPLASRLFDAPWTLITPVAETDAVRSSSPVTWSRPRGPVQSLYL